MHTCDEFGPMFLAGFPWHVFIQDAMRRGNAASLFFRVSCGRKVLETGKARIRELILELLSEVHFLGHDFERFEIMA